MDQCAIAQRKVQSLTAELEEVRINYETVRYLLICFYHFPLPLYSSFLLRIVTLQALRNKRQIEQQYEDAQARINELTTINVNLGASRAKLEQELAQLAGDYEEAHKELRVNIFLPCHTRLKQPELCSFLPLNVDMRREIPTFGRRAQTHGRIVARRARTHHQNRSDQEIIGNRS